jgi:hypothetical protein
MKEFDNNASNAESHIIIMDPDMANRFGGRKAINEALAGKRNTPDQGMQVYWCRVDDVIILKGRSSSGGISQPFAKMRDNPCDAAMVALMADMNGHKAKGTHTEAKLKSHL